MPMNLRSATRKQEGLALGHTNARIEQPNHNARGQTNTAREVSAAKVIVRMKEAELPRGTNDPTSLRQQHVVPQGRVTAFQALLCVVDTERARLRELEDDKDTAEDTIETKDGIYGIVDEDAVAPSNVYNGMESNGALQPNKTRDKPKVPSYLCGAREIEALNKPKAGLPVLATAINQSIKEEKPRARRARSKKSKEPAGPVVEAKKRKDKGKERIMNTGPSDEATGKPALPGGDVDEVAVHPPKIPRPRVRLLVRDERYGAAATISCQAKGEGRAFEPVPPPLVIPDGMRELRRRRFVSMETPVTRPRIRRQPETLPVMGKETMKEKKKEQPKRGGKRTRRDIEDDDAPREAPPRKRTEHAHSPERVATSLDVMA